MNIQRDDFVLEIGSGDNPSPFSHVLVDKFFEPTHHRKNTPMKLDERPLIIGDAERLPFKDQSFDYVICSHVIEHIPGVEAAFGELMRVAKAGYIETPSIYAERIVGKHDIHLWHIYSNGRKLFLNRKTPENISSFVNPEVFDLMFADFFWSVPNLFLVRYEWTSKIEYAILSDQEMAIKYRDYDKLIDRPVRGADEFDPRRLRFGAFLLKRELVNLARGIAPSLIQSYYLRKKKRVRDRWRRTTVFDQQSLREKFDSALCCPHCHGALKKGERGYTCDACDHIFESEHGIPKFL